MCCLVSVTMAYYQKNFSITLDTLLLKFLSVEKLCDLFHPFYAKQKTKKYPTIKCESRNHLFRLIYSYKRAVFQIKMIMHLCYQIHVYCLEWYLLLIVNSVVKTNSNRTKQFRDPQSGDGSPLVDLGRRCPTGPKLNRFQAFGCFGKFFQILSWSPYPRVGYPS